MKVLSLLIFFLLPQFLPAEEAQRGVKEFKTTSFNSPARLVIDVKAEDKLQPLRTIVIDPGHGGHEYGLIKDNLREKDVVFDIARRLRALIIKGPTRCFLTRVGDQFLSLTERADFSDTKKAEVFLSIHIGRHRNIVIYTPVITKPQDSAQEAFMEKTGALQSAIEKAIKEDLGEDMVSIKPLPYSILSKVKAAALIVELPSFEAVDYNEEFRIELTNTIYRGLYLYEKVAAN